MAEGANITGANSLVVRSLRKRYGDTRALDGVELTARRGEVLGVAGPNGAGKSTLVKILAGEEGADAGEVSLAGEPLTAELAAMRVAVVHQEAQLFPNLTVGENLMVGREGHQVLRPRVGAAELRLMEELRIWSLKDLPLDVCSLATRQRTEIARALARDASVFLFDEPNSALTAEESTELFVEIRRLADEGRVVILVSHRVSDLATHAARVVVVRDGRVQATLEGEALSAEAIAHQLVVVGDEGWQEDPAPEEGEGSRVGSLVLQLSEWSAVHGEFSDVKLQSGEGEIVALVGVEGSGARELLRSIADLAPAHGSILIGGEGNRRQGARRTAYVSETREHSLFGNLDVGENSVSRLGTEIADRGVVRKRRIRAVAADLIERFGVKTSSLAQAIRSLSGGNQQKVAIAAAVAQRPRVLLLEEPTRGVDVRSKRDIYRLLRGFALTGNTVLMFCTETSEVFDAADRVYVVSDGRISQELDVRGFARVEELASAITKGQRHNSSSQAAA